MGQGFGGFGMPEAALPSGGSLTPGSRPYNMPLGATSQPKLPSPEMADATSPELGNSNVLSNAPNPSAVGSAGQPAMPGPSKAHKLLTILQSGLQGALAGRAADERAVAASGGHRSGGFGGGFEAGFTLPWQRQQQQLGLQQQQAQIGALKAQSDLVQTPNGPIPGWLAKTVLPAQIRSEATTDAAQTRAGATTQAAQIGAGGRVQAAEIGQRFKAIPGVGLFDTQARQVIPGTQQGITVTPEIAQDYNLPADFIGKPMKISDLSGRENAQSRNLTTVQGAGGPALVNKTKGTAQSLGLGAPSLGAPREIADVNNPGQTIIATGSQALGQPGVQSASVQVPKKAAVAEVPTKIGDQKVAFTTMIQHADLLRRAAKALNNGDVQALSKLENAFKNEFGYSGPITAQAISDAYGGEVTNVIAKGHITDKEMEKTGKTLNLSEQNFETVDSVLNAYQSLAQSKMNMLSQQKNAAVRASQPNSSKTGGMTAADMLKKYPPKR